MDLPWDPAVPTGPHPSNLVPPESPIFDSQFFDAPCASEMVGAGEVGVGG